MKKQILIFVAVFTLASLAVAVASYHREIREWYRFRGVFTRVGKNAEGLMEYRHRKTGVIVARVKDGLRVQIDGSVERGAEFRALISSQLSFGLRENARGRSGWTIHVGHPDDPREQDFSMPVTPPFRSVNHRDIAARHFRNSDNSGPNASGPKNVNAPGEIRDFSFVLNVPDYERARELLNAMLWPGQDLSQDEARKQLAQLSNGHGTLTITEMKMDQLGVGLLARILSMRFRVELWIPATGVEKIFLSP